MNCRIQADDLPITVLESIGFMANHGRLRVADVEYNPVDCTVSFPLERFPVAGKAPFRVTRHTKSPVRCWVTFHNVTDCHIEDRTEGRGLESVQLLFGFKIDRGKIYLCSAAESEGAPCYELSCTISGIDIEIVDE